jgi:hypothetical protein
MLVRNRIKVILNRSAKLCAQGRPDSGGPVDVPFRSMTSTTRHNSASNWLASNPVVRSRSIDSFLLDDRLLFTSNYPGNGPSIVGATPRRFNIEFTSGIQRQTITLKGFQ